MSACYERISALIVEQLEKGTVPWRRPWGSSCSYPRNLVSGREYRGVNVFLLSCVGYESPYWLTYKQAQQWFGNVRRGEKSTPVIFWSLIEGEDRETGDETRFPVLRHYAVFNIAQCDGVEHPRLVAPAQKREFTPIEACERVVAEIQKRPEIRHGVQQACYRPSIDQVEMPNHTSFESPEGYYATLFHELGHATGHASRLNRAGITEKAAFGSDCYGREELVAEMASAFLCGHTGIETATIDNAAAYVAGWLKAIRQDNRLVVQAAAQAQREADLILGRTWDDADAKGGAA